MALDCYNAGSGNWLASSSTLAHGIGTGDFTVAAWVYPTATSAGTVRMIYANGALGSSFGMVVNYTTTKFGMWYAGGYSFDTTLTTSTWQHVGITRTSGVIRGYVNGTQEATTHSPTAVNLATATQYVGGGDSSSYGGRANLADVALWAAALSADEIKALAKRRKPPDVRLAGLKAYWPLNREINERWSSNLTMTAQNGTATYVDHVPLIEELGQFVSLTASGGGGGATKVRRSSFMRAGSRGVL